MSNAYDDLIELLDDDEKVEAVVFGHWGGWHSEDGSPYVVPQGIKGKLISINEAKFYMHGWSFYSGYGDPEAYAVYIWTNKNVIFVHEYDGSTMLSSVPRNPLTCIPGMS